MTFSHATGQADNATGPNGAAWPASSNSVTELLTNGEWRPRQGFAMRAEQATSGTGCKRPNPWGTLAGGSKQPDVIPKSPQCPRKSMQGAASQWRIFLHAKPTRPISTLRREPAFEEAWDPCSLEPIIWSLDLRLGGWWTKIRPPASLSGASATKRPLRKRRGPAPSTTAKIGATADDL